MIFDFQSAVMLGAMFAYPDYPYAAQAVVPANETNIIVGSNSGGALSIGGSLNPGPDS